MSDSPIHNDFVNAVAALAKSSPEGAATTSDLTMDEGLLLHGAGFEPTDLVSGTAIYAIPYGSFTTAYSMSSPVEITVATGSVSGAFAASAERLRRDAARSGAVGVVGVDVEIEIEQTFVVVSFTGTAIRPIGAKPHTGRPFVTDLSVRDFVLLRRAGWAPIDFAIGASFVAAPLQGIRQFLAQANQNVELVNLTQALQDAREKAMERMQQSALGEGASGVVDVTISDGPLGHSRHVLSFICYGTSVRLEADKHQLIEPQLVLPLDDIPGSFEASSLR